MGIGMDWGSRIKGYRKHIISLGLRKVILDSKDLASGQGGMGNCGQTVGVFRNLDVQKKLMLQDRNDGIGKCFW